MRNDGTGNFADGSRAAASLVGRRSLEILEAAFAPGANVSDVARRFDVSTGLIYTWRRQALSVKDGPAFVPATVLDVPGCSDGGAATIVVDFANGTKGRIACAPPYKCTNAKSLNITGDAFHPEWNYTIRPRTAER